MNKIRVMYIVSTLEASGPTNQLFNILKNIDYDKFEVQLVTLSKEPVKTLINKFSNLPFSFKCLKMSRIESILYGTKTVENVIKSFSPRIVHTQGIRADTIVSKLKYDFFHVATVRNFPPDDYKSKFGFLKGGIMVKNHFTMMRRTKHLVACSNTIKNKLATVGISSVAIQNGVDSRKPSGVKPDIFHNIKYPVFITVGSLIPRKNVEFLIRAFNEGSPGIGSLIVLGNGPLEQKLKSISNNNVYFLGHVSNVIDYLNYSTFFISASLSEGLPNTILESFSVGVPAILSNIDSHKELSEVAPNATKIFELEKGPEGLLSILEDSGSLFSDRSKKEAVDAANGVLSAHYMSSKYQDLYCSLTR